MGNRISKIIAVALMIVISITATTTFNIAAVSSNQTEINGKKVFSIEFDSKTVLPSSYVTENYGLIQNQGRHGDCWAFSTLATLEINLNKMGIINPDSEDGFFNFSESALVYYASGSTCSVCYGKNIEKKDGAYVCLDCGNLAVGYNFGDLLSNSEDGGFTEEITEFIVKRDLLVDEKDWNYNTIFPRPVKPENLHTYDIDVLSSHSLKNVTIDGIKRMCYSYGAATMGFTVYDRSCALSIYTDEEGNSYRVFSGKNMPVEGGHGISVIGYDDSFPKELFKIDKNKIIEKLEKESKYGPTREFNELLESYGFDYSFDPEIMNSENYIEDCIDQVRNISNEELNEKYAPKTDGAFLVKNSWGQNVNGQIENDTGLCWLPYDSVDSMNYSAVVSFTSASIGSLCDKKYTLDEFCGRLLITLPNNYIAANIYDVTNPCNINAVTFTTLCDSAIDYSIYYAPFAADRIITESKLLLKSGTVNQSGHHIIALDGPRVNLPSGKCAIMIELCSDDRIQIYSDGTVSSRIAIANVGESYVITDKGITIPAIISNIVTNFSIDLYTTTLDDNTPTVGFIADYSDYNTLKEELQTEELDSSLYFEQTWEAYQDAIDKFNAVENGLNVGYQEFIDNAVSAVRNARNGLIERGELADRTEYDKLYEMLNNNMPNEFQYTKESYENFLAAYSAFTDAENKIILASDQDAIDKLCDDLTIAIFSLDKYPTGSCNGSTDANMISLLVIFAAFAFAIIKVRKKREN